MAFGFQQESFALLGWAAALGLKEIHPEFTVDQVKAATEADLIIADDLKPMDI